jgi:hypothetical protein
VNKVRVDELKKRKKLIDDKMCELYNQPESAERDAKIERLQSESWDIRLELMSKYGIYT